VRRAGETGENGVANGDAHRRATGDGELQETAVVVEALQERNPVNRSGDSASVNGDKAIDQRQRLDTNAFRHVSERGAKVRDDERGEGRELTRVDGTPERVEREGERATHFNHVVSNHCQCAIQHGVQRRRRRGRRAGSEQQLAHAGERVATHLGREVRTLHQQFAHRHVAMRGDGGALGAQRLRRQRDDACARDGARGAARRQFLLADFVAFFHKVFLLVRIALGGACVMLARHSDE
jgi:hypothetical protein